MSGFWWCCFQYCVAVVWASRRVPGVVLGFGVWVACCGVGWLVSGVGCAKAGVGWLVLAGVAGASVGVFWLVCVAWFRMLMRFVPLSVFFVSCLFLLVVWLITVVWLSGGLAGRKCVAVGVGWCVCLGSSCWWRVGCCLGCVGCVCFGARGLGLAGVLWWVCGLLGCCFVLLVCARGRVFTCGVCERVGVSGESGCLGCGCVVRGGVLPVWLGDAVAGGGASVGFDVGLRVFTLGGVSASAPASGSASGCALTGACGVSSLASSRSASGGSASGSSPCVDGVRVCVPCAVRVFGVSWCSLVLRRWARAVGVDVARVDVLLGSAPVSGCVSAPGVSVSSAPVLGSVPVPASGSSSSSPSSVSASGSAVSSVSARSLPAGGGRVGAGFGVRVRDWGAWVGVGGGVVSGGGVVAGWWQRAVGRASGLVSGVGAQWLVLAGLVGVGWFGWCWLVWLVWWCWWGEWASCSPSWRGRGCVVCSACLLGAGSIPAISTIQGGGGGLAGGVRPCGCAAPDARLRPRPFCCRASVHGRAFPVAFHRRLWYYLFYAAHDEAPETTWEGT